MKKFTFALLLTACVGTGALAQAPVGVVQDVQGLVTVSQGNTMGNLVKDLRIADGARLVTTSTGTAHITLDNGCRITLEPNQAITIDSRLDCKALVAAIGPAAGGAAVAGGVAVSAGRSVALPVFLGLGAGMLLHTRTSNKSQNSSGS